MDIKKFQNYTVSDFAAEESFINYHLNLNEDDKQFWNDWILQHPAKKRLIREAKEIIDAFSLSLSEREYKLELDKIKRAINKEPQPAVRYVTPFRSRNKVKKNIAIAACLFTVIIFSAWLIKSVTGNAAAAMRTVASTNAPLKITLGDGTIVTLAPNSSLQFPSYFSGKDRQVFLKGDANFQVKHDEKFPFKVHAKNIMTTVLGTVFNIKNSGDSAIVVELLKGRVNVSLDSLSTDPTRPILLYPDEKAVYVFHNKLFYKSTSEVRYNLSFQKSTFKEIADRIREVYGLTVINNSNKKEWRFTGQFTNQNAEEVIESICLIKGLHSKKYANTIVITN